VDDDFLLTRLRIGEVFVMRETAERV